MTSIEDFLQFDDDDYEDFAPYSQQVIGIGAGIRDDENSEEALTEYRQQLILEFEDEFSEFDAELDDGLAESFADFHIGQIRSFLEHEQDKREAEGETEGEAADNRAEQRANDLLDKFEDLINENYPGFSDHWHNTDQDLPRLSKVVGVAYRRKEGTFPKR